MMAVLLTVEQQNLFRLLNPFGLKFLSCVYAHKLKVLQSALAVTVTDYSHPRLQSQPKGCAHQPVGLSVGAVLILS